MSEANVLPKLNQSGQLLPETVDVSKYLHLQDLKFPEVDVKRASIVAGSNVPNAHRQREVRAPAEKNSPYGYRYLLGWGIAGPLTGRKRRETTVIFISIGQQPKKTMEQRHQEGSPSQSKIKAVDGPLLEELAERIFAYLANQKQMA